jgi:hypothetical protein
VLNIDPHQLIEMREQLIQTGWFRPNVGQDSAVCVYMRRRELEQWERQLKQDLYAFREKQEDILKGILGQHVSKIEANSIGDLLRVTKGLAYTPEILRLENLGGDDQAKVRKLRNKLANIEILLLTEKLFSEYEEGWVPMEYLPGSLTDLRKSSP